MRDRLQVVALAATDRNHLPLSIAGRVVPEVLLLFVKAPVCVEVPAGAQSVQAQDRLGACKTPAGAGDIHAILDQRATGAFDDTRCDGQPHRQIRIVLQIPGVVEHVIGAAIDCLASSGIELPKRRTATDSGRDVAIALLSSAQACEKLVLRLGNAVPTTRWKTCWPWFPKKRRRRFEGN